MADPVTVLSIVNGSLGITLKIGKVIKDLHDIAQKLKHAELEILSTVEECEIIRTAWKGIEKWARSQSDGTRVDQDLLDRLGRSLILGAMVMSALDQDLGAIKPSSGVTSFLRRSEIVWKATSFGQHQARVRAQVGAMSLLLQVINLPSNNDGSELLEREQETLRTSDDSAWTIVNSRASIGSRDSMSIASAELVYIPFDFENDLFTARVYKRNYRPPALKKLFRRESNIALPMQCSPTLETLPESMPKDNPTPSSPSIFQEHFDINRTESYYIVVLGGPGSGKSGLTTRFTYDGDPYRSDNDRKIVTIDDRRCMLEVLSTAGIEEYTAMREQYMSHGDAFILCYSRNNPKSLYHIPLIKQQLEQVRDQRLPDTPLVLVETDFEEDAAPQTSPLERDAELALRLALGDIIGGGEQKVRAAMIDYIGQTLRCGFFEAGDVPGSIEQPFTDLARQLLGSGPSRPRLLDAVDEDTPRPKRAGKESLDQLVREIRTVGVSYDRYQDFPEIPRTRMRERIGRRWVWTEEGQEMQKDGRSEFVGW